MNNREITGVTTLPENRLTIPNSVEALMGITMFWQPSMETTRPINEMIDEYNIQRKLEERQNNAKKRKERGVVWKIVNSKIVDLGLPNTASNRKSLFPLCEQISGGNPVKIEESL